MIFLSNPEIYAGQWEEESKIFDRLEVYEKLALHLGETAPAGRILEFGCGIGLGTRYLARNHELLSLDNNPYLIEQAQKNFGEFSDRIHIRQCDFFNLTDEDKCAINDFQPTIIIGWLIGSHGHDIFTNTEDEPIINLKPKKYREKIEDIILSSDICLPSVQFVHFVNRGEMDLKSTIDKCVEATKENYNQFVFNPNGFTAINVKILDWNNKDSEMPYVNNGSVKKSKPILESIIARRMD